MKYFIIRFLIMWLNNPLELKRKLSEVRKIKKSFKLGSSQLSSWSIV